MYVQWEIYIYPILLVVIIIIRSYSFVRVSSSYVYSIAFIVSVRQA
jgi:hypothetical protein